jgi:hypothetical protein
MINRPTEIGTDGLAGVVVDGQRYVNLSPTAVKIRSLGVFLPRSGKVLGVQKNYAESLDPTGVRHVEFDLSRLGGSPRYADENTDMDLDAIYVVDALTATYLHVSQNYLIDLQFAFPGGNNWGVEYDELCRY